MIISFFSPTEYITWNDQSENPDCLAVFRDIDFDPETQKATLIDWKISVETIIKIEENSKLSSLELWKLILEKNFGGNINAQIAALSKSNIKMLAVLAKVVGLPTIKAVFSEEIEMARIVSKTRVEYGLSPFDLSFLD